MLDYGRIGQLISEVKETGQSLATAHYGRTEDSLAYNKTTTDRSTLNIAEDYYWNTKDNWNFQWSVWEPYYRIKRAEDPSYDINNDPNVPLPASGSSAQVIAKYQKLLGLKTISETPVQAGALAEIQPYWERMLIDTAIQKEASNQDFEQIDENYLQQGRDGLVDIFNKPAYQSTTVIFSYAQSDAFLKLNEVDQVNFITMSVENQYELVFINESERTAFINANTGYYTSPKTSITNYDAELKADKAKLDLDALMSRFELHTQQTGIDFVARFEQTSKEQTQDVNFSSIASPLNNVYQLYHGFLGRAPDKAGFEYWIKAIKQGNTLEQIAESFVNSTEFTISTGATPGTKPTFDQVLTTLYKVVLGREYDQPGYEYWQGKYNDEGHPLGSIVTGFTKSDEFINTVSADRQAWLSTTYGPNLVDMQFSELFNDEQVAQIIATGQSYDANVDFGYAGTTL